MFFDMRILIFFVIIVIKRLVNKEGLFREFIVENFVFGKL